MAFTVSLSLKIERDKGFPVASFQMVDYYIFGGEHGTIRMKQIDEDIRITYVTN